MPEPTTKTRPRSILPMGLPVTLLALLSALSTAAADPGSGSTDSFHVAVTPAYVNATADVTAVFETAYNGNVAYRLVQVFLPPGHVLLGDATAPDNWNVDNQSSGESSYIEFEASIPVTSQAEPARFTIPFATIPCTFPDEIQWRVKLFESASPSGELALLTTACDNLAPVLVEATQNGTLASTAGTFPFRLAVSDDSPLARTLRLVPPGEEGEDHAMAGETLSLPMPDTKLGEWRFVFWANDSAGNSLRVPATGLRTLTMEDRTLPVLAAQASESPYEAGLPMRVNLTLGDNSGDLAEVAYRLDEGPWVALTPTPTPGEGHVMVPGVQDLAQVDFTLRARDPAGNEATVSATLRLIDSQPPLLMDPDPLPDPEAWHKDAVVLALAATDVGASAPTVHAAWTATRVGQAQPLQGSASASSLLVLTFPQSGRYTLDWHATDGTNSTPVRQVTFLVDLDDPTPLLTLDPPATPSGWHDAAVTVTLDPPEAQESGLATQRWRLNGTTRFGSTVVLGEGVHGLDWTFRSEAGRESLGARTILVDVAPPEPAALGDLGPVAAVPARVNVTDLAGVDRVAIRYLRGDGAVVHEAEAARSGPDWIVAAPDLPDGDYTLEAQARDVLGHLRGWTPVATFRLTRHVPDVPFLLPHGAETGIQGDLTIAWTVPSHPEPLVVELVHNGISIGPIANGHAITTEGVHHLTLFVNDTAGNVGPVVARTAVVDRSAPFVTDPPSGVTYTRDDHETVFTVSPSESPARVLTSLDDEAWRDEARVTIRTEGRHVVRAKPVDAAGNEGPIVQAVVVLDRTPPRVILPAEMHASTTGTLAWNGEDALSPIVEAEARVFTADDRLIALDAHPTGASFPQLPEGRHTLQVRLRDAAGNLGEWTSTSLVVDPLLPRLRLEGAPTWARGDFDVTLVAEAFGKGVERLVLHVQREGGGTQVLHLEGTGGTVRVEATDGLHILTATLTDGRGRTVSASARTHVDGTPPLLDLDTGRASGEHVGHFHASAAARDALDPHPSLFHRVCSPACAEWLPYPADGITVETLGDHVLELLARDAAGNEALVETAFRVVAPPIPPEPSEPVPPAPEPASLDTVHETAVTGLGPDGTVAHDGRITFSGQGLLWTRYNTGTGGNRDAYGNVLDARRLPFGPNRLVLLHGWSDGTRTQDTLDLVRLPEPEPVPPEPPVGSPSAAPDPQTPVARADAPETNGSDEPRETGTRETPALALPALLPTLAALAAAGVRARPGRKP